MQKEIIVGDQSYQLYYTSLTDIAEEYLLDSLSYNGGLYYFLGSDCISVYIYMVTKENVPDFINNINDFIIQCQDSALPKAIDGFVDYLESIEDFSFLHKTVENSQYDIFISNFETPMIQENYDHALKIHEKFTEKSEKISIFSMIAGASYNDDNVWDFFLSYLANNDEENMLNIFQKEDLEKYKEKNYKKFLIGNNTDNEKILFDFTKLYWHAIPTSSSFEKFQKKMKTYFNNKE